MEAEHCVYVVVSFHSEAMSTLDARGFLREEP